MPFYEYQSLDAEKSCEKCRDIFEVLESIRSEPMERCPSCGNPVVRLISCFRSVVDRNREMNQYADVKLAKYWIDKNGNKHRVRPEDGHRRSTTVGSGKSTISAEERAVKEKTRSIIQDRERRVPQERQFQEIVRQHNAKKAKK